MLKFSQLVSKSSTPINLIELLQAQFKSKNLFCKSITSSSPIKKRKSKLSKNKNPSKSYKLEDLMTMQDEFEASSAKGSLSANAETSSTNFQMPGQNAKVDRKFTTMATSDKKLGATDLPSNGLTFTFMSYNILAQDLLELHPHLYGYSKPAHLEWSFRLKQLAKEITTIKPDILCLQEVQQNHIPHILKALNKLNFDHIFKKKTGFKTDGCAILYNRDVFDLLEKHTVEYYQPNVKYLDRENVALIAKLCKKGEPSSCFIASTTHLLYNPRRQDVRLAQVQLLLAELDHVSFKGFDSKGKVRRLPIILSGDFNLQPNSAPYNLITSGNLVYHNLTQRTLEAPSENDSALTGSNFLPTHLGVTDNCQHYDVVKDSYQGQARIQNTEKRRILDESLAHKENGAGAAEPSLFSTGELKHSLSLTSVYDHETNRDATTFQNKWITVDYIFYSQTCASNINTHYDGYLKLLSRYSLPSAKECSRLNLVIPNAHLGSDHLSLAAKFVLQAGCKKN